MIFELSSAGDSTRLAFDELKETASVTELFSQPDGEPKVSTENFQEPYNDVH